MTTYSRNLKRAKRACYALIALVGLMIFGLCAKTFAADEAPSRIWIERPWEYRYVIFIESPDDYELSKHLAIRDDSKKAYRFRLESLFPLNVNIPTDPEESLKTDRAIGAFVANFDKDGRVTTPNDLSLNLRGRLNRPGVIVLSTGDKPDSLLFQIGYWYIGRSRAESAYTQAICDDLDMATHLQNTGGRYQKGFVAKSSMEGNFGCREWNYYLKNGRIPYIDVTSYGKDKSTYIRPILGWGRFDVPAKPVIGKHGKVWVCLHECPNGDAPGIISDIKRWATKNNWPVPKPPKRQPMFPDPDYKSGKFVD